MSYPFLTARFPTGQLSRNGAFALGQSLVVMACLFLSYRVVIAHVGLEQFGVWSLLLAGSAFVRIGDVSGGSALARFVASAPRAGDPGRAGAVIHTVLLTSLALNCAIGLALWLAAPSMLPLFVPPAYMPQARILVHFVVASIVLGALAVAVTSAIDGAQRADRRAMVVVAASVVFLAACMTLVPRYGILGFGVAHVVQQAALLVIGWLVLRQHVPGLGWLPVRWRRDVFAETTGYAVKLNAIGVVSALSDPLAKFAFNHAGGPALVALYELAFRLIFQVRGPVVAAAIPLVPAFASRGDPADPHFRATLQRATRIAALSAPFVAVLTLVAAPIMSVAVLGHISPELLAMNAVLTAGYAINILAVPMYLSGQAFNVLRWNFINHALAAISVFAGIYLFVPLTGVTGLVGAIAAGIGFGSLVYLLGNAHTFRLLDTVATLARPLAGAIVAIVLLCAAALLLSAQA